MLSVKELKSMTRKELLKELKQARQQIQKARVTIKTGHEKNTSLSKKWKKYIARVLTFLNELVPEAPAKKANSKEVTSKVSDKKETSEETKKKAA